MILKLSSPVSLNEYYRPCHGFQDQPPNLTYFCKKKLHFYNTVKQTPIQRETFLDAIKLLLLLPCI